MTDYDGWPLIEIYGVGPDGTCHCPRGKNCKSAGKHPRGDEWQKGGQEPDQFRKGSNIGTLTGEPAGFWVLDIDAPGMAAMRELTDANGPLPRTRVHQTGGGTYHYFFKQPDFDVTNRRGALPAGIDARGTGGQVVLPPSRSAKGPYKVMSRDAIVDAPGWLLDMVRPREGDMQEPPTPAAISGAPLPSTDGNEATVPEPQPEHLAKYERMVIDNEVARLLAMQEKRTDDMSAYDGEPWDQTTYEAACVLMQLARSDWTVLTLDEAALLVRTNAPRDAGFDDARVEEKIGSALRSTEGKTRSLPTPPAPSLSAWMDDMPVGPATPPSQATSVASPAISPDDFFGKAGLEVVDLAHAIIAAGPIRMGQNNRWWTYADSGVWVEDKRVVINRTVDMLGNKFRGAHASNAELVVQRYAPELRIDTPDARLINFQNGMLDWSTGVMEPHDPKHSSSVQIPHAFDPTAVCPRFDAYLDSVMSPDYQRLVWEMIGYLLYSGNPLQVAFLLHGSGGDGKGTLIKVIQAMLGEHNIANQSLDDLNKDKFAPAMLLGKIANIAGDIDATFQESTAKFKMLTGEDRLSAQNKNEPLFSFNNYAVPLFSANKIPGSADVSHGYLRRWIVLEFDRKFEGKPIKGFGESLAATEVPGVIAKGLTYLRELMATSEFSVTGEATKGKDEFAKKIDQVRQWVEEECMEVADSSTSRADLYRDYGFWAAREGSPKISGREFYARLEGIGFKQRKSNGVRMFDGIALVHDGRAHGGQQQQVTTANWMENLP